MANRCSVCSHPQRSEIDAEIALNRTSSRTIASRFNLNYLAIQRHGAKHLPAGLAAGVAAARATMPAPTERQMAVASALVERVDGLAKRAVEISGRRLDLIQRIVSGIELIMSERAAAYAAVPGGASGLLAVREVSIRTGKEEYRIVDQAEFDRAMVQSVVELQQAAARETGEALAMAGRAAPARSGDAPLVMILGEAGSTIQVGAGAGVEVSEARHRILPQPRRAADASDLPPVPASQMDVEIEPPAADPPAAAPGPEPSPGPYAREQALSGVAPGPGEDAAEDDGSVPDLEVS